jgi:hypothetical protein
MTKQRVTVQNLQMNRCLDVSTNTKLDLLLWMTKQDVLIKAYDSLKLTDDQMFGCLDVSAQRK